VGDFLIVGGVEGTADSFKTRCVKVDFSGFEASVAHLLLDNADIDAVAEEAGGE